MRRASALLALPLCLTFALPAHAQQGPSSGMTPTGEQAPSALAEASLPAPRTSAPDARSCR